MVSNSMRGSNRGSETTSWIRCSPTSILFDSMRACIPSILAITDFCPGASHLPCTIES